MPRAWPRAANLTFPAVAFLSPTLFLIGLPQIFPPQRDHLDPRRRVQPVDMAICYVRMLALVLDGGASASVSGWRSVVKVFGVVADALTPKPAFFTARGLPSQFHFGWWGSGGCHRYLENNAITSIPAGAFDGLRYLNSL